LLVEDFIRAVEILSVTPAFLRGLVEKQIYAKTLKLEPDFGLMTVKFMQTTGAVVSQKKVTPAGYYTGIWCRDASYILDELTHMQEKGLVAYWLERIWRHQLSHQGGWRIVYGRGSPETGYRIQTARDEYLQHFSGSLPSSIQYNYSEVYAASPDIDSTALMISTTCKFLLRTEVPHDLTEKLLPRLQNAVSSLERRDIDGDSLLEQGANEDWMDNMLRSGKVVYSQAAWAHALRYWSELLDKVKHTNERDHIIEKYRNVVKQVDAQLWHNDSFYADKYEHASMVTTGKSADEGNTAATSAAANPALAQDVSLFLLLDDLDNTRVSTTLTAIKRELWRDLGVSCATLRESTGPRKLGPYHYQNGGFWPWITSLEILARLKIGDLENSKVLLENAILYSPFEWIDPYTRRSGSYPFKTGIAAVRTAVREFMNYQTRLATSS
jgi:glycogen debranching enzyme